MTVKLKSLLIVLITAIVVVYSAGRCEAGLVGQQAPPIKNVKWLTPNPPDSNDFTGRVYVVEFWATWCRPCMDSVPHMRHLAARYGGRGVLFAAVSVDRTDGPVKKVIRDKKINYNVAMDGGLSNKFSVSSIPVVFVVDHRGVICWQGHPDSPDFEAAIVIALKAAGAAGKKPPAKPGR